MKNDEILERIIKIEEIIAELKRSLTHPIQEQDVKTKPDDPGDNHPH